MHRITPGQLAHRLQSADNNLLLLDVREPWEFEYCHIPGSILIPMAELPSHLDELDREKEIIMICHHGIRSRQMGYYMEQAGFKNIVNLEGGVEDWARDVDNSMRRY